MTQSQHTTVIKYSRGLNKYDNTPEQCEAADFDAFERQVLSARSKRKGEDFICGPMAYGPHDRPLEFPGEDHFRLARHALPRRFLAADHDGFRDSATFERIYADLEIYRAFGYTTWSHTDERPRARVIFLLDRDVSRREGIALGRALDRMLEAAYGPGAVLSDKSTYRAEQPCYVPGPDAKIFHFEGKPLAVDQLLKRYPNPTVSEMAPGSGEMTERYGSAETLAPHEDPSNSFSRLCHESLELVLALIDCSDEPTWYDVCNALARAYGEEGRPYFRRFSAGDYCGAPYKKFDATEADEKFDRALRELKGRPNGYGVRHLIDLSGLRYDQVQFESASALIETSQGEQGSGNPLCTLPVRGTNNRAMQVSENLRTVLQAHSITVRYNQVTKRAEVLVPGLSCVPDEADNTAIVTVTDLAIKAGMSAHRIPEMLDMLASQAPYCPVRTYIESKPWDGTSRFGLFMGQVTCNNPIFAALLIRKWLIQAVAAVYKTSGIANAGVIVLVGNQGIGKTTLLKMLASGVQGVFLEGQTLDPADKDSVMAAVSHWIVELGELDATFKKSELSQLKAFITKARDTLRRPFARKESTFPRRTVFAGTVNDFQFLHDPTGNRRFWPIDVQGVSRNPWIDYQQLWAEVKTWYDAGEEWYLNSAEMAQLNQYSETFLISDPDVEKLLCHYTFAGCTNWTALSMNEICVAIGIDRPARPQTMRLAAAIRKYNGGQAPKVSNGVKYHYVPARQTTAPASSPAHGPSGISGTSGTFSVLLHGQSALTSP